MSEEYACLDAHAYVDNGFAAGERIAFEAVMRRDGKLRARVEAWQAQNEAIRLAFSAAPKPRLAPNVGRHSNENNVAPKTANARPREARQPASVSAVPVSVERRAPRLSAWRATAAGAIALIAGMLSFSGGPADPRGALMQRADTALRAIVPFSTTRLDFVSDDPRAVSAWLAPRFVRLSPDRLSPPGWSLLGVRVVPGLLGPAALVLFEDASDARAALLLEPMDGAPDWPTEAAGAADVMRLAGAEHGYAYAAVGPRGSGLAALIPPTRSE